jgi:hypothetical protein
LGDWSVFLKNFELAQVFEQLFPIVLVMHKRLTKMRRVTFWSIFSRTHLATLIPNHLFYYSYVSILLKKSFKRRLFVQKKEIPSSLLSNYRKCIRKQTAAGPDEALHGTHGMELHGVA